MSDEPVQQGGSSPTAREAVIRRDGRGEVRDGDDVLPLQAADHNELRALVMQRVIGVAAELDDAVHVRIVDVDGVYHLVVHPGGDIAEEGAVEALQPGDDELWSEAAALDVGADVTGEAEAEAPLDDDLDDDDGGFHDEVLDDEFDDEAAVEPARLPHHDGGYASLFGTTEGDVDDEVDDDTSNLHETIQLPRPGMMRDEPPAVTGMHPIIPPSGVAPSLPGSGAGSEIAAESVEGDHHHDHEHHDHDHDHEHQHDGEPHQHEWGDNRYTAQGQHLQDARGDEPEHADSDDGGLDDALGGDALGDDGFDDALESDPAFDDEDSRDDSVVVDWGTGGLDVVTGAVETAPVTPARGGVSMPLHEPPVAPDLPSDAPGWSAPEPRDAGFPGPEGVPAADAGRPEWAPNFPRGRRAGAPEAAQAEQQVFGWGAPPAAAGVSTTGAHSNTPQSVPEHHEPAPEHPVSPRDARDHTHGVPSLSPQPGASGAVVEPAVDQSRPSVPGAGPTLGDFLADRATRKELPASRGWRAGLRRTTGGLVNLGPGASERAARDEAAAIQRTFEGPKTIVVVNPKGGAHKTTTTLMIAAAFGMHRGGYTLAWDNNETRGTLGWRSHRAGHNRTAVDLLRQLSHFEISGGATIADVDRFVRNQGEAKFDVLASDDDAASAAIIDAEAFWRLHRTLSRFYRVLVIDTGNNMRASNWEAALDIADQLVIVSTAREDTAASAAWLADGLRERGHAEKLAAAVTVLSSPSPKEDPQLTARLRDHFAQLTRAVVEVPYDEEFVGGGELDIPHLRPETRDAWRRAAAVIAQGM